LQCYASTLFNLEIIDSTFVLFGLEGEAEGEEGVVE
jgi:hypothetical protein